MEETRGGGFGYEERRHEPEYQEVPGLLPQSTVEEVSFPCRSLVLGADLLGKQTCE
jgi:hypothetical protein